MRAALVAALLTVTPVTLLVAPLTSRADDPGTTAGKGAKTGTDAVVNGSRTGGRTVRAFFQGGTPAAKKTAKENAAKTKSDAKRDAAATKASAK